MGWRTAATVLTRFGVSDSRERASRVTWGGWFTLLGALIGLLLGSAAVLATWLFGFRAGFVVASVAVMALELWITRGRGYSAVIHWLENNLLPHGAEPAIYARFAVFQMVVLLKLGTFGVLAVTGFSSWFITAYALGAARVWTIWMPAEPQKSTVWTTQMRGRFGHWAAATVVAVLAAGVADAWIAGICAVIVSWLVPRVVLRAMGAEKSVSDGAVSLVWEVVVLSVLILGALMALS